MFEPLEAARTPSEARSRTMPWVEILQPAKVEALLNILSTEEIARVIDCTRERRYHVLRIGSITGLFLRMATHRPRCVVLREAGGLAVC